MAIDKPTKPTDLMPEEFALDGVKNNFSSSKIATGFSANFDDILQGDNLNYMLDSIGKQLNYLNTIADFINGMSIGKTITVNSNNKLDYNNLVSDVSNKANVSLNNLDVEGQAKFDDKANIDLSNTTPAQSFINSVKSWISFAPDYSRATTVSIASGGTIDWDGWLAIQMFYNGSLDTYASINGVTIAYSSRSGEGGGAGTTAAGISMVSNGDILTHNAGSYTIWKIPFKS